MYRVALHCGLAHPDHLLKSLTWRQHDDLIAFLVHTNWHQMDEWRDRALGAIWFITQLRAGGKMKWEDCQPPYPKGKAKKQTAAEMLAAFKVAAALVKKPSKQPKQTKPTAI